MDKQLRYNDFTGFLTKQFPFKVQKLSVNAGFTCPNRDGSKGYGGCTYCNNQTFNPEYCRTEKTVTTQLEEGKLFFARKYPQMKYLAYFQAYTNTYAPVSYLRPLFLEAIRHPAIVVLSIATRPDCINDEILTLLSELNQIKPVWIEFGLQTIHEKTADFIRREFSLACYETAVTALHTCKIPVITHVILGLPGETKQDMLDTVNYVAHSTVSGVKLQLLHVLSDTDLADYYEQHPFPLFTLEEYCDFIADCLELLPPSMVVHRITGDGPRALLLAPRWSTDKKRVLNTIRKRLQERKTYQGSKFQS